MRYGFRQGLAPTKVVTTLSYERGERERDQYLNFIWYNTLYSNTYDVYKKPKMSILCLGITFVIELSDKRYPLTVK